MQILIPVTLVSNSEFRSSKLPKKMSQSQKIHEIPNDDKFQEQKKKQFEKNTTNQKVPQQKIQSSKQTSKKFVQKYTKELKQLRPTSNSQTEQNQYLEQQKDKIHSELQKKSTRESLNEISVPHQQNHENEFQSSQSNIKTKKQAITFIKQKKNQFHLNSECDEQNQEDQSSQYYCKICLQEGKSHLSSEHQKNILTRVCKCHDFVHLVCLQQWINHRDILNQNIQPNQCEVCKQFYYFELNTVSFYSFKILKQNFNNSPFLILRKFLFAFLSLCISIFGLYILIFLFVKSEQNGGKIREILGMPYVTSIVIVIFLLFIVLLVLGISTYTFMMDYCLDFKYNIYRNFQQQQSSKNLKTLFTQWK